MTLAVRPPVPETIVGPGSAEHVARRCLRPGALLLVDPAVAHDAERLAGRDVPVLVVDRPATTDDALRTAAEVRPGAVLAVGGGNTMDLATLVAVAASSPARLAALAVRGRSRGLLLAGDLRRTVPLALVPSTVGTGSEVSPAAAFEVYDSAARRHKCLLTGHGLVADVVAYDPAFIAGPTSLYRSGLLEVIVRLVVPFVQAPSTAPRADPELLAVLTRIRANGCLDVARAGADDPTAWTDIALAGAESHSSWALRGRGSYPSVLWTLANELSTAAGTTKNTASHRLLGPWFEAVRTADGRWGSPDRLAQALGVLGADEEDLLSVLDDPWSAGAPVDPDLVAGAVVRRWAAPVGPTVDELRDVVAAAQNVVART